MENTNDSLTVVAAQEGPSVSVVGDTYRTNICSEQTNDAYALIDMLIPEFQDALLYSSYVFDADIKHIGTF